MSQLQVDLFHKSDALFRILDEKDKLARLCAQIASFDEDDGAGYGGGADPEGEVEDRRSHFDEMLKLSGELGEGIGRIPIVYSLIEYSRSVTKLQL